ncbi:MAG: alanine/ornithine racemase family PLP-dependent enzyme [Pygmaiobacter massiliensis]|nr:alanine/ornithine racemase family PLP-dependent enzyme [Pygmaiobacter massiliensis]
MYPCVTVNLACIRNNAKQVADLCAKHHIRVTGVTKVFAGDPVIAQCYLDAGITMLGDSRVDNLARMKDLQAEKWLIRPPMLSEVRRLVQYADVSLNSEIEVIRAISKEACAQKRLHKVILMADLGDIREGYVKEEELLQAAVETERLQGVQLYGIGTNLTCFSFVQPDSEKMAELARLRKAVSEAIGRPLEIVSGGNSATIDLMMRSGIPSQVDNLRLGESLLFGKERARYTYLPGTDPGAFILECEIVELKEKPSLPWGQIGVDSYGNRPSFTDRGQHRTKAVCALGKQDFDPETTTPLDPGILILGASSDHLMLDVTDSEHQYQVGDTVALRLGYFSTMRAFTSAYVEKKYLNE